MITFVINCKDKAHRDSVINDVCEALVGSPGYKTDEIFVGEDRHSFDIYVVVGFDGRQSVTFPVNGEEMVVKYHEGCQHLDHKG